MSRPRKSNADLPPCVHVDGGRYYFKASCREVRDALGRWSVPLGSDPAEMRRRWAGLMADAKIVQRITFGKAHREKVDGTRRGLIYVMRQGRGPVKIGFAADAAKVAKRVKNLQTGAAHRIRVVGFTAGTMREERLCHRRLSEHRLTGEWFDPCSATLAFVIVLLRRGVREALLRSENLSAMYRQSAILTR